MLLFILIKILPLDFLNIIVAQLQETILSQAGFSVVRDATSLTVGKAAFEIIVDCTGLVMMIMFVSLLYSTETRVSIPKILGYFAFFFIFNLFRLAFTIAIGANYGGNAIDIAHPVLWFVDSGVVFAAWAKEYGFNF